MRFLVSYIRIDTTIPDHCWPDQSAVSAVGHQYLDTDTPDYQECENGSDVEARFEFLRNYRAGGEQLVCPSAKIKVLRVELIPEHDKEAA